MNCLNGEEYIACAIASVVSQTMADWELIIVDNQSDDGSVRIAQEFRDGRIRIVRTVHRLPLGQARHFGLLRCSGSYVAFLDCDDWWEPSKLQEQLNVLEDTGAAVAFSSFWEFEQKSGRRKARLVTAYPDHVGVDDLLRRYRVGFLTVVIRRGLLEDTRLNFNPQLDIIHDYDLVLRLTQVGGAVCLKEPLATYRSHPKSETTRRVCQHSSELDAWIRDAGLPDGIRESSNFKFAVELSKYKRVCCERSDGNFLNSIRLVTRMRLTRELAKALYVLFIPRSKS